MVSVYWWNCIPLLSQMPARGGLVPTPSSVNGPNWSHLRAQLAGLDNAGLLALLRADQRRCWQAGQRLLAEAYRRRLPRLQQDDQLFLDLVWSEYLLREELGESPTLAEYEQRFPQFAATLRRQVALHKALAGSVLACLDAAVPGSGESPAAASSEAATVPPAAPVGAAAAPNSESETVPPAPCPEAADGVGQDPQGTPPVSRPEAGEEQATRYDGASPPPTADPGATNYGAAPPAPVDAVATCYPGRPAESETNYGTPVPADSETNYGAPSPADPGATRYPPGDPHATDYTPTEGKADSSSGRRLSRYFGGYELLEEIGHGGMGVVYKARHTKLNRAVALKMILAGGHAGTAELARFQTEAEAVARLQHPDIVQIFEVGEYDGLPFFSLEFCSGGSLDKKVRGTPVAPREAAALVQRLATAMEAAHQKGVIHRDLKPANVLLTEDGTPKITDFGLAKKLDEAGQTHSGAIMGTPSYMAPEQAEGKKDIGPAADIYALGAMLYDLLTGRPPFKGATPMETIRQVVSDEPVPPSRLLPSCPRDLETVCLKCLHKEPRKRYGSAADLAEDLRRFQAGEPITARPVGSLERGWRWCRRNPVVATLTLFLVLVGATMIAALQAIRSQDPYEVIVAVPVASPDRLQEVRRWCDDVVCLLAPDGFWAVGQFYEDFTQVEDGEVVRLLRDFAPAGLPAGSTSPA
jgi:tRNA A-37 threonylcarbamoyl transferase component Bud32